MAAKRVLVYGGKGALGAVCIDTFKSKGWWTCCLDLVANEQADCNVLVQLADSLVVQSGQVEEDVGKAMESHGKFDAIVCVAGGWAGGNAASKDFVKNCDTVIKQSLWTSVIAARLAAKHLSEGGLLQLTGAQPALGATSGMIGYGFSKAAVHQMVASLADEKSGLPEGATSLAILPVTLNTPMNRKWMATADQSTWTPLEFVAGKLHEWASDANSRPASGSLVQLITTGGVTELKID